MEYYLRTRKLTSGILQLSILRRTGRGTDKTSYHTLTSDIITSLNIQLRKRYISNTEAMALARKEVARLQEIARDRPEMPQVNQRALQQYWDSAYAARVLSDPDAARNRLYRAVDALGGVQLLNGSALEIQTAILANIKNVSSQRDAIAALQQLLKFLGRSDVVLHKPKAIRSTVKYLTAEEVQRVTATLPEWEACAIWIAFATGCRTGEIFALETFNEVSKVVFVKWQLYRTLTTGPTKGETENSPGRWSPVLKVGVPYLKKWIARAEEDKHSMRTDVDLAEVLKKRCQELWENDPQKHCVFHDLRHSYAIHLLNQRFSIEQVARCLGNSIAVCQRHYLGFVLSMQEFSAFKDA